MLNRVQLIGQLLNPPRCEIAKDGRLSLVLQLAIEKEASVTAKEQEAEKDLREVFEVIILKENLLSWGKNALAKHSLIYVEGRLGYKDDDTLDSVVVFVKQHGQLQLLNAPEFSAKRYRNFLDELQNAFPSARSHKDNKNKLTDKI